MLLRFAFCEREELPRIAGASPALDPAMREGLGRACVRCLDAGELDKPIRVAGAQVLAPGLDIAARDPDLEEIVVSAAQEIDGRHAHYLPMVQMPNWHRPYRRFLRR